MKKTKLLIVASLLSCTLGLSTNTTVFAKTTSNLDSMVQTKANQSFKGVVLTDQDGNLYSYVARDYLTLVAAKDTFTKSLSLKYVTSNMDKYYEPRTFLTYKALNNGDISKTFESLELDKKNFDIDPIVVTNDNGEALIEEANLDFIIDDIS